MLRADLQDIENMSSTPAEFTREWKPCKSTDLQGFFFLINDNKSTCKTEDFYNFASNQGK